jgi:iron donor protein CyaY
VSFKRASPVSYRNGAPEFWYKGPPRDLAMSKDGMDKYFADAKKRLVELEDLLLALDEELNIDCELVDTKMTVSIAKPKAQWVISTNSGAKQIWMAALTKSWKLDEDGKGGFVLKDSGQSLKEVVSHCLTQQLGKKIEL